MSFAGPGDLRRWREATHICLSHRLVRKIGPAFASSVGGRFFDPKELCATYFAYGSRFASPLGDSLNIQIFLWMLFYDRLQTAVHLTEEMG